MHFSLETLFSIKDKRDGCYPYLSIQNSMSLSRIRSNKGNTVRKPNNVLQKTTFSYGTQGFMIVGFELL